MVGPEGPPLPVGASTFADPARAPLTGHFHLLKQGTPLPPGLAVLADGVDVYANSPHSATHHTFYPAHQIAASDFITLFLALPWQYGGRKP
jgi:hypothetical protein